MKRFTINIEITPNTDPRHPGKVVAHVRARGYKPVKNPPDTFGLTQPIEAYGYGSSAHVAASRGIQAAITAINKGG